MRDDYRGHPEEIWKNVPGTADVVNDTLIDVPMQLLAASPKVSKSSRLYI